MTGRRNCQILPTATHRPGPPAAELIAWPLIGVTPPESTPLVVAKSYKYRFPPHSPYALPLFNFARSKASFGGNVVLPEKTDNPPFSFFEYPGKKKKSRRALTFAVRFRLLQIGPHIRRSSGDLRGRRPWAGLRLRHLRGRRHVGYSGKSLVVRCSRAGADS